MSDWGPRKLSMMPDEIAETVKTIVDSVKAVIAFDIATPPTQTVPREFGCRKCDSMEYVTLADGTLKRCGDADDLVPPGATRNYRFGADYEVKRSVYSPYITATVFALERPFLLHSLIVDDETAEHFEVTNLFLGAESQWHPDHPVPAKRFAAAVENLIVFNKTVPDGNEYQHRIITVQVRNTSSEKRAFNAKVTGLEPVPHADHTDDLVRAVTKCVEAVMPATPTAPREFSCSFEVQPNWTENITIGEKHALPNSGIAGLPETVVHAIGVPKTFYFESLVIDEECLDNFTFEGLFTGSKNCCYVDYRVKPLTCRAFALGNHVFGASLQPGTCVTVQVKNTTDKPLIFKAKAIGREAVV